MSEKKTPEPLVTIGRFVLHRYQPEERAWHDGPTAFEAVSALDAFVDRDRLAAELEQVRGLAQALPCVWRLDDNGKLAKDHRVTLGSIVFDRWGREMIISSIRGPEETALACYTQSDVAVMDQSREGNPYRSSTSVLYASADAAALAPEAR